MIRIVLVIILLVTLCSVMPLANSNAYLKVSNYETVYVKYGDTVWSIADHYVTTRDDIRELTQAIKELNGLNNNAQISPGQALKIPMK